MDMCQYHIYIYILIQYPKHLFRLQCMSIVGSSSLKNSLKQPVLVVCHPWYKHGPIPIIETVFYWNLEETQKRNKVHVSVLLIQLWFNCQRRRPFQLPRLCLIVASRRYNGFHGFAQIFQGRLWSDNPSDRPVPRVQWRIAASWLRSYWGVMNFGIKGSCLVDLPQFFSLVFFPGSWCLATYLTFWSHTLVIADSEFPKAFFTMESRWQRIESNFSLPGKVPQNLGWIYLLLFQYRLFFPPHPRNVDLEIWDDPIDDFR